MPPWIRASESLEIKCQRIKSRVSGKHLLVVRDFDAGGVDLLDVEDVVTGPEAVGCGVHEVGVVRPGGVDTIYAAQVHGGRDQVEQNLAVADDCSSM